MKFLNLKIKAIYLKNIDMYYHLILYKQVHTHE